jgi:transcriptional regulator with XRE-family HTH domain
MEVVTSKEATMSMTQAQARRLGELIAKARARKGLSTRALAAELGVAIGWITELENGRFLDPAPDRLARLAEALDIEPGRIDRLTKGAITAGLPTPRVYFRSKMSLTPEETDKVLRYIDKLRRAG